MPYIPRGHVTQARAKYLVSKIHMGDIPLAYIPNYCDTGIIHEDGLTKEETAYLKKRVNENYHNSCIAFELYNIANGTQDGIKHETRTTL